MFGWLFGGFLLSAFAVVRHADCLAIKLGEPYGTLILTLSVIGMEVMMVSAVMLTGGSDPTLARDTMFSVLMIVLNGLFGLALLAGGWRHGEQQYNLQGARPPGSARHNVAPFRRHVYNRAHQRAQRIHPPPAVRGVFHPAVLGRTTNASSIRAKNLGPERGRAKSYADWRSAIPGPDEPAILMKIQVADNAGSAKLRRTEILDLRPTGLRNEPTDRLLQSSRCDRGPVVCV
jgi:hypothetical protein